MTNATTYATALRAFDHAGDSYPAGSTHRIDTGHFGEWSAPGVDLVRKATATEIAKANGTKPAAPKRARRERKPAAPSAPAKVPEPQTAAPVSASDEA